MADLTSTQSAFSQPETASTTELEKDNFYSPFLAFGYFKSNEAILEDIRMTVDKPFKEVTELCQTDKNEFPSPASTSTLINGDEFKENKQSSDPYLAFGKFKADPIGERAAIDKVEEVAVEFKADRLLKRDKTEAVELNAKDEDKIKAEEKYLINFDDAGVSYNSSKPQSPPPPPLLFGESKRDSTEPQTIKSEVIGQDINILIEDPSVVEASMPANENTVRIEAEHLEELHAHVEESVTVDDRAARLASVPVSILSIHDDVGLIPHDEDADVVRSLHEDNVQTPRNSPATVEKRPVKRQRFSPELPTVDSVRRTAADTPSTEELNQKLEKMKNPKVKKLQGFGLSLDTVRDRLLVVGLDPYPITLEKELQDVMFKRQFISSLYGGNTQSTLPSIGKHFLDIHGLDDFMYPNLDLNPHAPEMPGSPGLFFGADGEDATPWDSGRGPGVPERVITRICPGIWQYQGQYILSPAKSLTKGEWAAQSPKVHSTWAKQIMKKDWGRIVRCRVSLRKRYGREFTEEEFEEAVNEKKISYKNGIDENDILQALLRGDEFIAVWTMKCVGYDADFQRNLVERYPTWAPPPSKSKKGPGSKGQGRGKGKKTTATPKQEVANSDEWDDSGNESDSDYEEIKRNKYLALKKNRSPQKSKTTKKKVFHVGKKRKHSLIEIDEEEEPIYRSRGTRSRPIQIFD